MPVKNPQFDNTLNEIAGLDQVKANKALVLLRDLVKVDHTKEMDFRTAIFNKKADWKAVGFVIDDADANDVAFLSLNGPPNFADLSKKIIHSYVQQTLRYSATAKAVDLENIIKAADGQAIRDVIKGSDFFTGVLNNPLDNAAIIDDPQALLLRNDAAVGLLLSKAKTEAEMTALLNQLAAVPPNFDVYSTDVDVRAFLVANKAAIEPELKRKLAFRLMEEKIKSADSFFGLLPAIKVGLTGNDVAFKALALMPNAAAGNPVAQLIDNDIVLARAMVAERYLQFAVLANRDFGQQIAIANSATDDALVAAVKLMDGNHGYIDILNTPEKAKHSRELAAIQAVRLAVEKSRDPEAIKALAEASSLTEVKNAITLFPELNDKQFLIASLVHQEYVSMMRAAAIAKNAAIKGTEAQLKDLLAPFDAADPVAFGAYRQNVITSLGLADPDANDVKLYLGKAETVESTKLAALEALLKNKVQVKPGPGHATDAQLVAIRDAAGIPALKAALNAVLPVDITPLNLPGLVAANDPQYPQSINTRLAAYAATELLRRGIASQALLYPDMLAALNDVNGNLRIPSLASLTPAEKTPLTIELAAALLAKTDLTDNAAKQNLLALTQTNDLDAFKAALGAGGIGINNTDWVTEAVRETLLKEAYKVLLTEKVGPNHPALLATLIKLPSAKQKEILEKNEILKALQNERDPQKISRNILNGFLSTQNVTALAKENQNFERTAGIHNVEIAKVLRSMNGFEVTENLVSIINEGLGKIPFDDAAYTALVISIEGQLAGTAFGAGVRRNFGVDMADQRIPAPAPEHATADAILQQRNYNQTLYTALNQVAPGPKTEFEKEVIRYLLTLNKNAILTIADNTAFTTAIKDSTTYEAFKIAANQVANRAVDQAVPPSILLPDFAATITAEQFLKLKSMHNKESLANGAGFGDALTRVRGNLVSTYDDANTSLWDKLLGKRNVTQKGLRQRHEEIRDLTAPVRTELENLAKAGPAYFLDPVFQATAKKRALSLQPYFKELDKQCAIFLKEVEFQLEEVKTALASLPDEATVNSNACDLSDEQKKELAEFRSNNLRHQSRLMEDRDLYIPIQKMLRGDPDIDTKHLSPDPEEARKQIFQSKGYLVAIDDAIAAKKDVIFGNWEKKNGAILSNNCMTTEHDATKRPSLMAKERQVNAPANNETQLINNGVNRVYTEVDRLADGKIFEHTISCPLSNGNSIQGRFIEEHHKPLDMVERANGIGPAMVLTLSKVPTNANPQNPQQQQINPEAMAYQAMMMARKILAGRSKPPTVKNPIDPIIIRSPNAVHAQYLWTALTMLSDKNPNMRFDPAAIQVDAPFDPSNETTMGMYSRGSLRKTVFDKSSAVKTLVNASITYEQDKKEGEKESARQAKDTRKITTIFKDDKKNVLSQLEQESQNRPDGPKLTR